MKKSLRRSELNVLPPVYFLFNWKLADVFVKDLPSHKAPYVFLVIGSRSPEQLLSNVEASEISLSDEQIKYVDSVVLFEVDSQVG